MHILVTNDDGVFAPGLLALAQWLRQLGKVTIIAPDRSWSAAGHVKTMHRPLRVWETQLSDGSPAWTSDGAPSDCVALALLGLVKNPLDLVVSGINPHANIGHDVTYSGTVTAAMEATISAVPGIAVSLDAQQETPTPRDFQPAARIAQYIAQAVLQKGLPHGVLLNVNVPHVPLADMRGFAITRQGLRLYRDALVRRRDPRGRPYYWIGGEAPTGVPEPGTDFWALAERYISITPLQLDLTAQGHLDAFKAWDLRIPL
jgi:5'-nucleotidase